jgi:predicted metal-dependent hydrolase
MFDFLKPPARAAKQRRVAKRTRQLVVHDKVLPLTVQEHPRSTRMTLRIDPGGRALKLTVPVGLSNRDIDGFLDRQQGWLMTRLARFKPEAALAENTMIPIRGVEHRVQRTGKLRDTTRLGRPKTGPPRSWSEVRPST